MRKPLFKLISGVLSLVLLISATGCGPVSPEEDIDIQALTDALLSQVTFDTPLADVGSDSTVYFPDLPENAQIRLYMGSGYYADELAVITLADKSDASNAQASIDKHLEQKYAQFSSYIPEELPKIKNAVVWNRGVYFIVCITNDTATAEEILKSPTDYTTGDSTTLNTTVETTLATEETTLATEETTLATEETTVPTEATTVPVEETTAPTEVTAPPDPYAVHYYESGVVRVGTMAYEIVYRVPSSIAQYAQVVNRAADAFGEGIQVYDLLIPTSMGIVFPEEAKANCPDYVDQSVIINDTNSQLSGNVRIVDAYNKLLAHKDEYLYFRTDYHWNGPAAYYAYEAFCETKGITPYTMDQREELQFDGYLGYLYWYNSDKDPILKANPDTVYAYKPATGGVTMTCTDKDGNTFGYPIIADVSDWSSSAKYMCFAAGDQPFAEFKNPNITDGSACIVIKESFGNALMSYIVDHYSTVYEIDYRYWKGDIAQFAKDNGVTDVIFANNLSMLRNNYLIGKLSGLFE